MSGVPRQGSSLPRCVMMCFLPFNDAKSSQREPLLYSILFMIEHVHAFSRLDNAPEKLPNK